MHHYTASTNGHVKKKSDHNNGCNKSLTNPSFLLFNKLNLPGVVTGCHRCSVSKPLNLQFIPIHSFSPNSSDEEKSPTWQVSAHDFAMSQAVFSCVFLLDPPP